MTTWHVAHVGFYGDDLKLGGLSVWNEKWRRIDFPAAMLAHPAYPDQIERYDVWEIGDPARPVRFAACELSNGVWGFYVPGKSN
jgi:hypothetical protein